MVRSVQRDQKNAYAGELGDLELVWAYVNMHTCEVAVLEKKEPCEDL